MVTIQFDYGYMVVKTVKMNITVKIIIIITKSITLIIIITIIIILIITIIIIKSAPYR